jgi:hypothetical protein
MALWAVARENKKILIVTRAAADGPSQGPQGSGLFQFHSLVYVTLLFELVVTGATDDG